MRSSPETDVVSSVDLACSVPYEPFVLRDIPPEWQHLIPLNFHIARRQSGPDALLILPGFGVSITSFPVDQSIWQELPQYGTFITHPAINFPTQQEFILDQYVRLLSNCDSESFTIFALSLGGSTALQLLSILKKHKPEVYTKCRKLVTLGSPVKGSDLTPTFQRVLQGCNVLAAANRGNAVSLVDSLVSGTARAVLRLAPFEDKSWSGQRNVLAYAGETFQGAEQLEHGSFPEIDITAIGLRDRDAIVQNAHVERYGSPRSKFAEVPGIHTPRIYHDNPDMWNTVITRELKTAFLC